MVPEYIIGMYLKIWSFFVVCCNGKSNSGRQRGENAQNEHFPSKYDNFVIYGTGRNGSTTFTFARS